MNRALDDRRLVALAADIRAAHDGVQAAARTAADRAIEAGHALLEAKKLLKHGAWLPWLRDQCGVSERSAQIYMHIARLGLKSATVADLGLRGAAKAIMVIDDPGYDVFVGCSEEDQRQWLLYALFGVPLPSIEWIRQKPFQTPDEWIGPEGAAFRRGWGMRAHSPEGRAAWAAFQHQHRDTSRADIEAQLAERETQQDRAPVARRARARHRAEAGPRTAQ